MLQTFQRLVPDFVAPRELNPDIPAGLERVVLKCLERDPEKRYLYLRWNFLHLTGYF